MLRLWRAFLYSLAGIKASWKDEQAFRLEVYITIIMMPIAFFMSDDLFKIALMIASLFLVLAAELINSAIEAAIDRMGEEEHPLSKKAKDCGSAAVLFTAILSGIVWLGAIFC